MNVPICDLHSVEACIVCLTDDFYEWLYARKEARRRYKREWAATPVSDRFDLGGES